MVNGTGSWEARINTFRLGNAVQEMESISEKCRLLRDMWRELDDRSLFRELRIFDMQFIIDS